MLKGRRVMAKISFFQFKNRKNILNMHTKRRKGGKGTHHWQLGPWAPSHRRFSATTLQPHPWRSQFRPRTMCLGVLNQLSLSWSRSSLRICRLHSVPHAKCPGRWKYKIWIDSI
ncbi:hypothetical protein M413DRAFT_226812 [Hebeloma cylindrosporum]|uniref:Uncharacterized protein n=1 Tax=Hebeloma cylindrosporum TaxID=76867 RepID=A0A0C3CVU8_HEBCY|nr:hypothetical protein M413DRAFT_226812 [Hebeloma cylindrosporum h7]